MQISLLIRCFTPAPLQAISGHYFGLEDLVHTLGFGLKNFTWWNSHMAATVNIEKKIECLFVPCLNLLKGIDLRNSKKKKPKKQNTELIPSRHWSEAAMRPTCIYVGPVSVPWRLFLLNQLNSIWSLVLCHHLRMVLQCYAPLTP